MPFYVSLEDKVFIPAPEGLHSAVCVDVIDLGMQATQWGEKPKLDLVFQIEEINPETKKRFTVHSRFTVSLHEKSGLRKALECWRGRKFSKDELKKFDLEKLVGAPLQIQVVHNVVDDGKVYANVNAFVPLGKGMEALKPLDYVRKKDREEQKPQPITTGTPTSDTGSYDDDTPF